METTFVRSSGDGDGQENSRGVPSFFLPSSASSIPQLFSFASSSFFSAAFAGSPFFFLFLPPFFAFVCREGRGKRKEPPFPEGRRGIGKGEGDCLTLPPDQLFSPPFLLRSSERKALTAATTADDASAAALSPPSPSGRPHHRGSLSSSSSSSSGPLLGRPRRRHHSSSISNGGDGKDGERKNPSRSSGRAKLPSSSFRFRHNSVPPPSSFFLLFHFVRPEMKRSSSIFPSPTFAARGIDDERRTMG